MIIGIKLFLLKTGARNGDLNKSLINGLWLYVFKGDFIYLLLPTELQIFLGAFAISSTLISFMGRYIPF
jgi:hypothetical protein